MNESRNLRVVELDVERVLGDDAGAIRQLLYIVEMPSDPAALPGVYASDIVSLSPGVLLVTERRTDKAFAVNVGVATDITPYEDEDGTLKPEYQLNGKTTIEQLTPNEISSIGIQPLQKLEIIPSLKALDPGLSKCEGITVVNGTIFLCHDNDFDLVGGDFSTSPATLIFQDPPNPPKITTTPLPEIVFPPLP